MKKLIPITIIIIAIAVCAVIFVPKLFHTCSDCDEFFVGWGYEPNIVADLLSSDEEQVICEDCAKKQHAIAIGLGKDLSDFQKDYFGEE